MTRKRTARSPAATAAIRPTIDGERLLPPPGRARGPAGGRGAPSPSRRAQHGAAVLEGALSVSALVVALAILMGIIQTLYTSDKLARAARAAARAVALLPAAPASESALDAVVGRAIRRELDLDRDFNCRAIRREPDPDSDSNCGEWTVTIGAYPTPAALLAGEARGGDAPPAGENGDMILVRIGWSRAPWPFEWLVSEANADGDTPVPVRMVATGVARNERVAE